MTNSTLNMCFVRMVLCSHDSHFCLDLTPLDVLEVEKQTIPRGMHEIHFTTYVVLLCIVNFNVLDQFFTDEKEKCPIIL